MVHRKTCTTHDKRGKRKVFRGYK